MGTERIGIGLDGHCGIMTHPPDLQEGVLDLQRGLEVDVVVGDVVVRAGADGADAVRRKRG
jgi:hypothetical protein